MTTTHFESIVDHLCGMLFADDLTASIFLLLASFVVVVISIPKIIFVAFSKRLTTPVISRSSHTSFTPAFGGVAIYLGVMLAAIGIQLNSPNGFGYAFAAAITFIFIVGLKDDLVNSPAKSKLMGEIVAILLICFHPSLVITDFHGFLGIHEISPWITIPLSILFLIIFINSYNLIDGIDGLAGMIGILIASFYGYYFFLIGDSYFFLLSVVVIGALIGFLFFNFSKTNKKIFMGDCGSLVVGLVLGVLSIRFLTSTPLAPHSHFILPENKLSAAFFVLFTPIFDTIRVIIIRILKGRSPFEADKNHLHHVFVLKGISHKRSTLIITILHFLILVFLLSIASWLPSWVVFTLLIFTYCFVAFALHVYRKQNTVSIVENPEKKQIIT